MIRIALAIARRPALWRVAARQARRMAPRRWWRHRPFLPVPSGGYLEFRLVTQYGSTDAAADPGDVCRYLEWCREWDAHR